MNNLYNETIAIMKNKGYTSSDVDYCSVIIDGHEKEVQFDFDTFKENSNFEYNDNTGDIEINLSLRIVFNDGTWLERDSDEGFEWWRHVVSPKKSSSKFYRGFIDFRNPW